VSGRIVLTSFGYDDPGGGTLIPRTAARELAARGWDVTVFHAAVREAAGERPYTVREWDDEHGVHLVGVFNRPHGLLDLGHPGRELDDPPIARAFARILDDRRPDAIHYHNLHNLGLSLADEAGARGIPAWFTPHNFWLVCARNHFVREGGALCEGAADGGRACAACARSRDAEGYARRQTEIRERIAARVEAILPVSETVRTVLEGAGFDSRALHVQRLAAPAAETLWRKVGANRAPGRAGAGLRAGFIGSLAAHKGAHLAAEAVRAAGPQVTLDVHGEIPDAINAARLTGDDHLGQVTVHGSYTTADLPAILASIDVAIVPSLVWETAGLTVLECLAAGVPVIVSAMGGLIEGVTEGVDGLVVDGRSSAGLTEALRRLATEDGLLEQLQTGIVPPKMFAAYVDELEALYRHGELPAATGGPLPVAVQWTGDQQAVSSLATINREIANRLAGRDGIAIERNALDVPSGDPPLPRPADIEVRHAWPPDFTGRGVGRLALIQPWEFGAVPRDWQQPLVDVVDELWVPSEYVARMYRSAGVAGDRVHVVANGVDLERFRPEGPALDLPDARLRLLFVGGTIYRKGVDLLIEAFGQAFPADSGVLLVVKDIGGASFYKGINLGDRIRALEASGRVAYIDRDLDDDEVAALYRACDVLVHPYRGEGFAMPVLEAMACGRPVVVTAGGPTDEFVPDDACWRIPAAPKPMARFPMPTVGTPVMLEPDLGALTRILRAVAEDVEGRAARGRAGRRAAEQHGWDVVADAYAERIRHLAARPPRVATRAVEPFALPDARALALLAAPAWRGSDDLATLLSAWAAAFQPGDDACLYLLADPTVDGEAADWERHVLDAVARAGVDLERLADISVLDHAVQGDDLRRIHAAVDAFVPLHRGSGGHLRLARSVVAPTADALSRLKHTPVPAEMGRTWR
jgi:glycosyltransferase involved in cell wall biosynthesis